MGIFSDLGQALADAARVRVAIADPNDGTDIFGEVIEQISDTHVRLRCEDGLVFQVAKAALRFVHPMEAAS